MIRSAVAENGGAERKKQRGRGHPFQPGQSDGEALFDGGVVILPPESD
jgi:hypothetical protein